MALVEKREKYWLSKAPYSTISSHAVRAHLSIPKSDSTPAQFGNSLPKTYLSKGNYQTHYHPTRHQMRMKMH